MPTNAHPRGRRTAVVALAVVVLAIFAGIFLWRNRGPSLPSPGSAAYEDVSRVFYTGLAALQVGLLENALQDFTRATTLVPVEPAAWANLGVARLRLGELDAAAEPIERARALAPDDAEVALLAARMEIARGRLDEGIAHLRRAVMLDDRHLRARFALAEELERAGTPESAAEALRLLDELSDLAPDNIAVRLESARAAATRGDAPRLNDAVARLQTASTAWPPIAAEQYEGLRAAASAGDFALAARSTALLRNVLARVPAYAADLSAVRTPAEIVAEPFEQFLALAPPVSMPAPPDMSLAYATELLAESPAAVALAVSLNGDDRPAVFVADGTSIRRLDGPQGTWPFPGRQAPPGGRSGLLPLDWNNDFRTDLFAAGADGVLLLLQTDSGGFEDATADAAREYPVSCPCSAAWAADVEMDGDLDVIVGVTGGGTIVLRNNGDGSWTTLDIFAAVTGAQQFAWADLDADADPDAVFLDGSGAVRVFLNRQAGQFAEASPPPAFRDAAAMTVADLNADGIFDVITSSRAGDIRRASMTTGGSWDEQELAAADAAGSTAAPGTLRLFAADLDNNGALDLIRSGPATRVWIADEQHRLTALQRAIEAEVTAVADLDGDGRLDLLGLSSTSAGAPVRLQGSGDTTYHWKGIRVRAQPVAGDQRVNSFGVGGEIEVRSGLLRQKAVLTGMPAHFGLGTRTSIDVARIVWPNGIPQAEFGTDVDDAIVAEQRLKGSCPWVFAYDGEEMRFVTDFLWRSPLGLRINAQDTAGVNQTEDWVRIRGDQLAPRDGMYDLRITAELWETHFFDHVSLMVLDHPPDTEVFVDERFAAGPVTFSVQAVRDMQPVLRARDASGADVTELVSRRDGRHLASLERGRYQGIAREHYVEFEVAGSASGGPAAGRVLVAQGWVYPTDSSINVAVGQGRHERPRGLALEAQDASGAWVVLNPDLGFPAGKNKTMLIDLSGAPHAHRFRLRTNMEVYWDALATGTPADVSVRTMRLELASAELRYRGFSRTSSPRGQAPETPEYAPIAAAGQRWRDLVGYHTRFGDVRELLLGIDDRYVIMNAGDELLMQFPAPEAPPDGQRRDFVLIGDGWEKDGDYNTEFSQTVLPLPSHGAVPYDPATGALELEDDPVYQRHRADWERYHTRYVTPGSFVQGLGK
jgi:tetratricopeptide (TPR) repeat protein